ncbi:hypothetical protein DdX_03898 [Ditylenchus destructor]|uniref:Uncharacterized protein n=1 Tax=Ditylenchus destructor TaxID=166010 RepID=A0AAD4R8E5_9BILA|nr:hypothetical protein DdX_03898 [Ditylenchus destructor]
MHSWNPTQWFCTAILILIIAQTLAAQYYYPMYGALTYDYRKLYEGHKKSHNEKRKDKIDLYCLFYGICDSDSHEGHHYGHVHYPQYYSYGGWPGYGGGWGGYGYYPYYTYGK